MRLRFSILRGGLPLLAVALALPAAAQTGVAFEFSFSDPGARSLGFGGAFAALADDATAAFANPAGLVQLVEPEISLEVRSWSYSTPYTRNGRFDGVPTGLGIDTEPGIARARSEDDLTGLSYLAFVYPRERWSIAFYRHQLANFEFSSETQGLFGDGDEYAGTLRLFDRRGSTDLEVVTLGVAVAFELNDRLSLGVGLVRFEGTLRQPTQVALWDDDTQTSFFAENSYLPGRILGESELTVDDTDWGLGFGLLWRPARNWHLGGFFRGGPELTLENRLTGGPASTIPGLPPGASVGFSTSIAFPDVLGLGAAFCSTGQRFTASFEWRRIEYSSILDSLANGGELAGGGTLDDGDELHLGAEYVFFESSALLAVRAGAWLDPDHQVHTSADDAALRALLPEGDDEMHYALGFGVALKRFQLDLAADLSERVDTLALSAIYSF